MTGPATAPLVTVVGLGPGDPGLVTVATREAIDAAGVRFLRTTRHPSAPLVESAVSFDHHYETADTFEEVYRRMVADLVAAAVEHGSVLYAVPGSPRVLERTVELLDEEAATGRISLTVVPAMSFVDLAWVRLGVDPYAEGVRLVDGHRFSVAAAGERGPLLVAHCHNRRVLSDVKLAVEDPPADPVVVLQRLGLPDEAVTTVAWADLDRVVEPDHLTSVYIPALAAPVAGELAALEELVATLRDRCPWDGEQTHATLARHLLEETYEVLEALDGVGDGGPEVEPDLYADLEEELGDLLFQVVFHARLATEAGAFTLADVARGIHDKLVHRHPHVFGSVEVDSAEDVAANWEQIKKAEKGRSSVFEGIPVHLPALAYATKIHKKATTLLPPGSEATSDARPAAGANAPDDETLRLVHLPADEAAVDGASASGAISKGAVTDASAEEIPDPPAALVGHVELSDPAAALVGVANLDAALAAVRADPTDADAVGDLLLAVVAHVRPGGVDAESALRVAANRLRDRARTTET